MSAYNIEGVCGELVFSCKILSNGRLSGLLGCISQLACESIG